MFASPYGFEPFYCCAVVPYLWAKCCSDCVRHYLYRNSNHLLKHFLCPQFTYRCPSITSTVRLPFAASSLWANLPVWAFHCCRDAVLISLAVLAYHKKLTLCRDIIFAVTLWSTTFEVSALRLSTLSAVPSIRVEGATFDRLDIVNSVKAVWHCDEDLVFVPVAYRLACSVQGVTSYIFRPSSRLALASLRFQRTGRNIVT
jgi:hypothetical protein